MNFLLEGAGLSQHFSTVYRNAAVDSAKNTCMQSRFAGSSRRGNGEGR